ncbi:MAG: response regulator [Alphaproteobacteria bacterium]|nr:response regulator [Alphaproteobacteria bacterium]MBU6473445.1 response regulator [Alphaproteobacteria bacterium]MDE2012934.1 response regulator [Alphaproteobacteria bacterium]MDE2352507.1 response regulator [Alphaproteobacteria bacterium]
MHVLIIDDHTLFRVGLKGLLERRGIEVSVVGNGEDGVRVAGEIRPDVVLLDLQMPGMSGIDVLQRLRETGFVQPVVMLTTSNDERDLVGSLRCGAQGYLLKDMDPDALVRALHEILSGKTVVTPDLTTVLAKVVRHGGSDGQVRQVLFEDLTPRELEILRHLAEGESNKIIARHLGISDGTVKLHVKAILRKLGLSSRVEAAVLAVQRGLGVKP